MIQKIMIAMLCYASLTHSKVITSTLEPIEQELMRMSALFNEVVNLVHYRYYKALNPEHITQAIEEAIQAYVHRDPHSGYLSEKELRSLKSSIDGEFYGIGVVLPGDKEIEEEAIPFIEIIPDGPAEKAGLKAGDKLIEIDDAPIKGLKIEEVMSKLKGERNTKVKIRVLRDKYPDALDKEVTRDTIKDEVSLSFYLPHQNICYLLLPIFGDKSAQHIEKMLKHALSKKAKGIIIDLRNNTGGLFDASIDIASLFVPKGTTIVVTKNRENKITQTWKTKKDPVKDIHTIPIFFIVNNYTASSAEILAGSLRSYAEQTNKLSVFIVGSQTFGKGSVQEVVPLRDGGALRLTSALYFLPQNICIQGKGIEPDFAIEDRPVPSDTVKWMTDHYGRESGLKGAIKPVSETENDKKKKKETKKKKNADKPWKEQRKEWLANNYLFQTTINLIDLLIIGKKANQTMASYTAQRAFLKENYVIDKPIELKEL